MSNKGKKIIIITYGTFDMFHVGHLRLLKRLKEMGDELIVAVSSDKFNAGKGKKTIIPCKERMEIIKSLECVDRVIKEKNWKQKEKDVQKYGVDIFAIGEDWQGDFDFLSDHCEVLYLPRTSGISTTKLKKKISKKKFHKKDKK